MESRLIRQHFLDFFKDEQHRIVSSAPIVVKNDPTLMFTNAGMNQFKDFFLGNQPILYKRIADTQKCLRVSGKHNDLEEVGTDGYHHTMFEMLGNWSFGDYFKAEAIAMAWKLLTQVYGLRPERLFVSVFGGDKDLGLDADFEAVDIWKKWIPEDQILFFGRKDNFWEMGDTGPCGPCSEIHVDLRTDDARSTQAGQDLVNAGSAEVMEIWNLVFIQYNRKADGSLEELPAKHIDTGMGFERISMVLQNKKSSYDTDIFQPIIQFIAEYSKIPYTGRYSIDAKSDMAIRVLADHIRAVSFAIADGAIPAHTGSGYVIRRILRRAVRYYYSFLNIKDPFLFRLVPILEHIMSDVFPELKVQREFIINVIREEELSFLRTLEDGLKQIDQLKITDGMLSGKIAFELYDTYGFPFDLTCLIAKEHNWIVDETAFLSSMEMQKNRSRVDAKKEYSDWHIVHEGVSSFIGYDTLECEDTQVLRWRLVESKGQKFYHLVIKTTPFYSEGGGQVGDIGNLFIGNSIIEVIDTIKENDLIIHIVQRLPEDITAPVICRVNGYRREKIENNHSATHLLHAALRRVLGDHVQQKGSLVQDEYLRFDFSHFQKLSETDIAKIESLVNEKIRQNIIKQESRMISLEEAKASGAMMLFGEKYGDKVRMITFDSNYSTELCGGCHVESTGQIGFFKIVAESSVATGIRRIEALTSSVAENYVREKLEELDKAKQMVKNPKDLPTAIDSLLEENKRLQRQIQEYKEEQAQLQKSGLISKSIRMQGIQVLISIIQIDDSKIAKSLLFQLGKELSPTIIVVGFAENNKPQLMCYISEDLVKSHQFNASAWIRQIAKHIDGGGGGQDFFASAGGKNMAGLPKALEEAHQIIQTCIQ